MASVATLAVRITGDIGDVQAKLQSVADTLDNVSNRLKGAGTMLSAGVTAPILGFGGAAVKAAADYEQLQVAFTTMLGSAEKANNLLADMQQFAAETPFESDEIQRAGKMLLAYGTAAEDITGDLRKLGDLAAGVGAPLESLAYLYGTARTQGRLFQADINQFTNRGIPILEALAETMGVAQSEIKGMVEEGKVGFPELQAALAYLTDEGGKFHGLMEAQSTTLTGLFSTLKDNVALSMIDIGNAIVQAFDLKAAAAKAIEGVETIKNAINDLVKNNPELLRTGVIVAAVAAALGPALIGLGFAVGAIKQALTGISAVVGIVTGLSAPVLLLIGAVAALGAAWYFNWFNMREIVDNVVEAIRAKWEEFAPVLTAKATEIGTALTEAWGGAMASLKQFGDEVLEPISLVVAAMTDAGVRSGEAAEAIGALPDALQPVALAFGGLWASAELALGVLVERWGAVRQAFAGGETSVSGILSEVATVIGNIGTGAVNNTPNILNFVGALTGSQEAIDATADALAAFQIGGNKAYIALQSFGLQVQALGKQIVDFLQPTIDRVVGAFSGLPDSMAPILPALQGLGGAVQELWDAVSPLLIQLGTLWAAVLGVGGIIGVNLFASAINALGPTIAAALDVAAASIRVVAQVLTEVTALIRAIAAGDWAAAWEAVKGIVLAFTQYVATILGAMLQVGQAVATGLLDAIKGALDTLNVDGAAIMETIKSWWSSAWETMAQAFKPVEDGINNIKSMVEGLKQAIDNFRNWIGSLNIQAPWANWKAPSLPGGFHFPGFQLGTTYARGGPAVINEGNRGEIVVLPKGAAVVPHQLSKEMFQGAGGGISVVIQQATIGSEADSWRLAYQIDDLRRRRRL